MLVTQVVANWLIGREILEEEQKGKKLANDLFRLTILQIRTHLVGNRGSRGCCTPISTTRF